MSFKVEATPNFLSEAKRLSKKFKSLKFDIEKLSVLLTSNPEMGTFLGANVYKVRLAMASKRKR